MYLNMWFIYRITNNVKSYHYIGMTTNIEHRVKKHNEGATTSTKPYRPFDKIEVLHTSESRIDARKWEKYYKSGIGRQHFGM